MKFGYIFAKKLRTMLKKFLDNPSKRLANITQTFFDKPGFQKLEKKHVNRDSLLSINGNSFHISNSTQQL